MSIIQITSEGYEVGNEGDETTYPVISVVWDEGITEYPDEYIGKCIEAFERFDLPEEIHQRHRDFVELRQSIQELSDRIAQAHRKNHSEQA